MMSTLFNILKDPNDNGFVVFILGILFILSTYHILLYFHNKDKVYLLYSFYTFLIFIRYIFAVESGFIYDLFHPMTRALYKWTIFLVMAYNIIYFAFVFTFINLKEYSLRWHKGIFRTIYFLILFAVIVQSGFMLTNSALFLKIGYNSFVIVITVFAVISYIPLFKVKDPLKYYIIIGSFFLLSTSLTATLLLKFKVLPSGNQLNYGIFYLGVIIENIMFTLALGRKQWQILKLKNESQEKLIRQLKENEKLKSKIQQQLEENVVALNKKSEEEKLEKIKARYEKEFTDLKLSSLRSQMNPHFIFNSLNSIKLYIINNEKENAVYYLNKFSKLIRKILATTQDKEISLSEEIETMKLYLNIENIRFKNEINYNIVIDNDLNIDTIKIPGLILQPFLENAVWHGLSLKKGNKNLTIKINRNHSSFVDISIIDNGIGRQRSYEINKDKSVKKESFGIKITKDRLKNYFKDFKHKCLITFTDLKDSKGNPKGTKVVLRIPLN